MSPPRRADRPEPARPGRADAPSTRPIPRVPAVSEGLRRVYGIDQGTTCAVLVDGVVAGQRDRLVVGEAAEDDARRGTGQGPDGPASPREDTVVAGGMARGQAADSAQEVGDGAASGGQDGAGHEVGEAGESRPCEGAGEGPDQWAEEVGYYDHEGLLVGERWGGAYLHTTSKRAFPVDAIGPPKRAEVEFRRRVRREGSRTAHLA
jgi:hypothetical protein